MRGVDGTEFSSNLLDSGYSSKQSLSSESVFPIYITRTVSLQDGIWACGKLKDFGPLVERDAVELC